MASRLSSHHFTRQARLEERPPGSNDGWNVWKGQRRSRISHSNSWGLSQSKLGFLWKSVFFERVLETRVTCPSLKQLQIDKSPDSPETPYQKKKTVVPLPTINNLLWSFPLSCEPGRSWLACIILQTYGLSVVGKVVQLVDDSLIKGHNSRKQRKFISTGCQSLLWGEFPSVLACCDQG